MCAMVGERARIDVRVELVRIGPACAVAQRDAFAERMVDQGIERIDAGPSRAQGRVAEERRGIGVDRPSPERRDATVGDAIIAEVRSEEHTSELQSLMRISYAVFCLKKKKIKICITKRNTQ